VIGGRRPVYTDAPSGKEIELALESGNDISMISPPSGALAAWIVPPWRRQGRAAPPQKPTPQVVFPVLPWRKHCFSTNRVGGDLLSSPWCRSQKRREGTVHS